MTDVYVCARCQRCCVIKPGEEELIFPLTDQDIALARARQGDDRWLAEQETSEAFRDMLRRMFPDHVEQVLALFPLGGNHHRLGLDDEGRCKLLGPEGCVLPPESRPTHCRLFPIWARGGKPRPLDADCLAMTENSTLPELLEALRTSREEILELHARLLRAWGLE